MILFTMMLIPTIVALGFYLFSGKKITIGEFAGQNVAQLLVMSLFVVGHGCASTHDVEVWNGQVRDKQRVKVSCSHSYPCRCRQECSGSGNSRSCHTVCDTCYEHWYDVDWMVHTTNDESIEISRVDRQGLSEPPRWTAVQIGEPTAVTHSYTNYVKAAPDSLFRKQGLVDKYKGQIPAYPGSIYDYYRLDRLVLVNGATVTDSRTWNQELSKMNGHIGRAKEVNLVIVMVKDLPAEYFYALEQAWIGAKKNDFVSVIGVDGAGKVQWANVMAWTDNKMAEVVVRDHILKIGDISQRLAILESIGSGVNAYYVRKPMKDFKYLQNSITPSVGVWVFAMILGLIISVGLGIFFRNNDYDQDDEFTQFTNRRRF